MDAHGHVAALGDALDDADHTVNPLVENRFNRERFFVRKYENLTNHYSLICAPEVDLVCGRWPEAFSQTSNFCRPLSWRPWTPWPPRCLIFCKSSHFEFRISFESVSHSQTCNNSKSAWTGSIFEVFLVFNPLSSSMDSYSSLPVRNLSWLIFRRAEIGILFDSISLHVPAHDRKTF